MFVTNKFGFVHMPKTGGTWLTMMLHASAPAVWQARQHGTGHLAARLAPPGLRLWSVVRNPWDWYVSLFSFHQQQMASHTGSFTGNSKNWSDHAKEWADVLRETDGSFKKVVTGIVEGKWLSYWWYSRLFQEITCDENGSKLCGQIARFEKLRTDCIRCLAWATGAPVPALVSAKILHCDKFHTSKHAHYSTMYSPELARKVARADIGIVDEFGYKFEP